MWISIIQKFVNLCVNYAIHNLYNIKKQYVNLVKRQFKIKIITDVLVSSNWANQHSMKIRVGPVPGTFGMA